MVKSLINTEDTRRLSPAEQHDRRRQVIRAYKRKINKRQIAEDVGLSYPATCKIIDCYDGSMAALAPRKRGRRTGDQETHIRQTICDKRPSN